MMPIELMLANQKLRELQDEARRYRLVAEARRAQQRPSVIATVQAWLRTTGSLAGQGTEIKSWTRDDGTGHAQA